MQSDPSLGDLLGAVAPASSARWHRRPLLPGAAGVLPFGDRLIDEQIVAQVLV